ncbi:toxin-antitoxin system YwqK family antitoxin [Chitinophaga horti]|uniref:Toxin-antitoxin system YwqK family antitoxin n=1 Tax=Chitinophaga horti TaxID=2920382 RepID=A0ABY6J5Q0_9BACT|nr:toxin-antitoxin system YwqK family antitoxin [Chitinophaga horti]UYQ94947.1 toxin-antitoxin system YwqK family antitoxin [Chitinophaga horti]
MKFRLLFVFAGLTLTASAQRAPKYTPKHFVTKADATTFKPTGPLKNGTTKSYIETRIAYFDVDDNNTTAIKGGGNALVYFESEVKGGKRNGITRQYLIDSLDHQKLYLLAEQTYKNDKLNGTWKYYNLKGTVVRLQTFKDDSLHGLSRDYWIDGVKVMNEFEFFNGRGKYIERGFHKNGNVSEEVTFINGIQEGEMKIYYETGVLQDQFNVKNGKRDGLRTYYYPNGKPWIQVIFKDGNQWTVVANYDSKGNKRNAGTLKDGDGTLIMYDDDTTVRETVTFKGGQPQQ